MGKLLQATDTTTTIMNMFVDLQGPPGYPKMSANLT